MERLHQALRPTRGAAASIVHTPGDSNEIAFIGVGNALGVVTSARETRRLVGFNGTLGHALKSVRTFTYATSGDTIAVLASDGLGTHWSLDAYPGLRERHPALIAGVLYRDHDKSRDDVTVDGRQAEGRSGGVVVVGHGLRRGHCGDQRPSGQPRPQKKK